ncbi:GTP 3',8-cyclase MoaA [Bacillus massiliigorillae]|uniref:GTP 3',8-cyclase MoaA n=1 Tax=Bacillus massiliigorillae TaxID=1243664 RepID=UPI0003A03924|nr:GTP 3',8-cyclase MoaA [Bacillus massiliigorillae]
MTTQFSVDQLQRPLHDLRISVTDRCNFRCAYCMPKEVFGDSFKFMPRDELLSFEEIYRLSCLFASLGVKKLRLTGGEPLLRHNLEELIKRLNTIEGIKDMGLTTNGVLLKKKARALYDAGLRRLNISLDALDSELFGELNGRGFDSKIILENIKYAQDMGFTIKVNMVVQKGVNDNQVVPMADYFKSQGIELRYIEFMDVGNDNDWSYERVVSQEEILRKLQINNELTPSSEKYYGEVAKRYKYSNSEAEVGFIPSVSKPFCSSCTRGRLSSDGKFYNCLFASEGVDLRQILRNGSTDEEILKVIRSTWEQRNDRYSEERTEQSVKNRKKINMSFIGG